MASQLLPLGMCGSGSTEELSCSDEFFSRVDRQMCGITHSRYHEVRQGDCWNSAGI